MARLTPDVALARARRGIAFLDRKAPGWRRKIRRARLDLSKPEYSPEGHGCGCVLAQLDAARRHDLGWYARGANAVGVRPGSPRAVTLGFEVRAALSAQQTMDYAVLTDAWRTALREPAGV